MRWTCVAGAAVGAWLAATQAVAAVQPPGHPVWVQLPTVEEAEAAYPADAKAAKLGGRVVLACAATADGALAPCTVAREEPAGQGFGAAAIGLSNRYRMAPQLSDGRAVAGLKLNIPIRFGQAEPPLREVVFHKPGAYADLGPVGPYYPERASRMGVQGMAVLECRAAADGVLTACKAINEAPADWGFEYAAMRMAQGQWIKAVPRLENGQPVDGETVRLQVTFKLGRVR